MDSSGTHTRSNILEKLLFDTLMKRSMVYGVDQSLLEEKHLKKLNSIVSNLPYELVRQSYERSLHNTQIDLMFDSNKPRISTSKNRHSASVRRQKKSSTKTGNTNRTKLAKTDQRPPSSSNSAKKSTSAKRDEQSSSKMLRANSTISTASENLIVIHVCDESKRLKQDFTCPKELLVKEMKYFSKSLSMRNSINNSPMGLQGSKSTTSMSQKNLDEIDISVHCDINIFDWLMRYVKRDHPYLIEKNIATPTNSAPDTTNNVVKYSKDGEIISIEPKLDIQNCVSILLSSDFLLMGNLVDKCIVYIAQNIEQVVQVPCVMSSMNENLLSKLSVCLFASRLDDLSDKKDKIKTKMFQRKIEFMFDVQKYKEVFENSKVLTDWRFNKNPLGNQNDLAATSSNANENPNENYLNYLYECENDASTLFKCRLCSRLMTKRQAVNLQCQLAILNTDGEYVYLHVPDEKFDLTNLLQHLKERLKSWQAVYWFLWALIKSFKCKKCLKWFRLIEINKCRLNSYTFCPIHDVKKTDNTQNSSSSAPNSNAASTVSSKICCCIYCEHILDQSSAFQMFSKSPLITEASANESPELRMSKFAQSIIENIEKHKDLICYPDMNLANAAHMDETMDLAVTVCDLIEKTLKLESQQSKSTNVFILNRNNSKPITQTITTIECQFIDSITGKHISLFNRNQLNLIRIAQYFLNAQMPSNEAINLITNQMVTNVITNILNMKLDLKQYLSLISIMDPVNAYNSLDVFPFLRVDAKMKWDLGKPVRLNQDNQREDDLKRFREICGYLVKAKLIDDLERPNSVGSKSPFTNTLFSSFNSNNANTKLNSYAGGFYCRIENDWKNRTS
jgi:hypothetical protein